MELLVVVLFVQVHAVGEHFLDVADFDWHVRRQVRTVNVDTPWVDVAETPDPQVLKVELELSLGNEME